MNFDLLNNESFVSGKKQYLTRRRKKLNQARVEENYSVPMQKRKPSRIIVLSDSSGEETSVSNEKPMKTDCSRAEQENAELPKSLPSVSSAQHTKTAGETSVCQSVETKSEMLLDLKASVSELLDFHTDYQIRSTCFPPAVASSDSGKEGLQAPTEVGVNSKQDLPLVSCFAREAQVVGASCFEGRQRYRSKDEGAPGDKGAGSAGTALHRLPSLLYRKLLYSQGHLESILAVNK